MRPFGRLTASVSQLLNKRGIYLGRRSTQIHVAVYRRSRGRLGGHIPGWPEARIALLDHVGTRTGARRTSPVMYSGDERAQLWSKLVAMYPGSEFYERNAAGREIPIVVLEPRI